MITENEKKGRVKGRQTREFNDYFDDYYEQMVSWNNEKNIRGLMNLARHFGP